MLDYLLFVSFAYGYYFDCFCCLFGFVWGLGVHLLLLWVALMGGGRGFSCFVLTLGLVL